MFVLQRVWRPRSVSRPPLRPHNTFQNSFVLMDNPLAAEITRHKITLGKDKKNLVGTPQSYLETSRKDIIRNTIGYTLADFQTESQTVVGQVINMLCERVNVCVLQKCKCSNFVLATGLNH